MHEIEPQIGDWYHDLECNERFEIVAIDDDTQTLAIQYATGEVTELEFEQWNELELTEAGPPDDWSAPFDDLEGEDIDPDESRGSMGYNPLDSFE